MPIAELGPVLAGRGSGWHGAADGNRIFEDEEAELTGESKECSLLVYYAFHLAKAPVNQPEVWQWVGVRRGEIAGRKPRVGTNTVSVALSTNQRPGILGGGCRNVTPANSRQELMFVAIPRYGYSGFFDSAGQDHLLSRTRGYSFGTRQKVPPFRNFPVSPLKVIYSSLIHWNIQAGILLMH